MQIKLIIGLPGSGKTYLGKSLQGIFIDDPVIPPPKNINTDFLVIADCYFCNPYTITCAKNTLKEIFPDATIECLYFENNPEKCLKNIQFRNDGRKVTELIKHLSSIYKIPDGVLPIKIWNEYDE